MRVTVAGDLFVFAGAGVSRSAPSGLPVFNRMRDALCVDLEVPAYEGLVPEPVFRALYSAGVDVEAWLAEVLDGTPNAVHQVLAQLALRGARVWTVNFEELVERAAGGVDVCAWPEQPRPAQLLKPHGTLSGPLIVRADQVLNGLDPAWERRLRADVAGRHAVFVGYSARDLDFRPLWRDVLATARSVTWFSMPDPDERRHVEQVVGLPVDFRPASGSANPSREFVEWCLARGVAQPDPALLGQLDGWMPERPFPPVRGMRPIASGALLELTGDIRAARRKYLRSLLGVGFTRTAARRLLDLEISHGGRPMAAALTAAHALPPVGRLAPVRRRLRRKRVTILLNTGAHARVLAMTRDAAASDVSTDLILRAGAMRFVGRLDEAADLAGEALRRARAEGHNVRSAHAAFQVAVARLWAARVDLAEVAVADLAPLADLAGSRWRAWSRWCQASLATYRRDDPHEALGALDEAAARFAAEGLLDGVISALTVRLTVLRQAEDASGFAATRSELDRTLNRRRGVVYYTRGHQYTAEAIAFEDGEHARACGDLVAARRHFDAVARSPYRLHQALGHLGLAAIAPNSADKTASARQATRAADSAGADGVAAAAVALETLSGPVPPLLFP